MICCPGFLRVLFEVIWQCTHLARNILSKWLDTDCHPRMLQGFVHASFQSIKSTDAALALLRQFKSILQRDSLKADLDAMYSVRSKPPVP